MSKPKDILMLESSIFNISNKCFKLCTAGEDFSELALLSDASSIDHFFKYKECVTECTIAFIQTREYLKAKFLEDYSETLKLNDEIYTSYTS